MGHWLNLFRMEIPYYLMKLLVVQGDLPNGWSMTSDIVPVITSPSFQDPKKGLFTHGREFYRLGDDCPDEPQDWNH